MKTENLGERVKNNKREKNKWMSYDNDIQGAAKDTIEILEPLQEVSCIDVEMLWLSFLCISALVNEGKI